MNMFQPRRNEYSQAKVFHHPDRIAQLKSGDFNVIPVSVELDVTNVCPHTCFYCYEFIWKDNGLNWGLHKSSDFTRLERATELLHEMGDAGVKAIEYCG